MNIPTQVEHRLPGLVLREHRFDLPLDHSDPSGETIEVFAREVVATDKDAERLPWLVFLQGGPGYPSPRPMGLSGWIKRVSQDYRILLLDQRGTGCSTPVSFQSLERFGTPDHQANYLKHFRSDSIVRDCELIRERLLGDERWTVLGQSYGGFCSVRYLSAAPEGLAGALIAGGLPPLEATAEDIYRATYLRLAERNRLYYERYPDDVARVREIVTHLNDSEVLLPCGDRLTPRRFQQLGLHLGMSDGFEAVHYLLREAFLPGTDGLTYTFLRGFENALSFDTNPIFSVLHEACYTQGAASGWAAERVRAEHPEFAWDVAEGPVLFTGEMIYPWMFEEIGTLRPLREAAEILAQTEDWPQLYDAQALERNTVPCAAALYIDDMYVERGGSEQTAARIGALKTWVTNEYQHNGLRADGERLVARLLDLLHGRA